MKKNGLFTFVCACVPGAGQMYYGYMKRGLSLLAVFCIGFALTSVVGLFGVVLPVVWMYAFFDTYDLVHRLTAGNPKTDAFLFAGNDFGFLKAMPNVNKLIGWVLVGMGVWALYANFVQPLIVRFFGCGFSNAVPTVVVAALLILGGLYLLGVFKKPEQRAPYEETPYPHEEDNRGNHH